MAIAIEDDGFAAVAENASSNTANLTCSGSDRCLVAGGASFGTGGTTMTATYETVSMTELWDAVYEDDFNHAGYRLVAPATTVDGDLVITASATRDAIFCGGTAFSGVDQTTPVNYSASTASDTANPSMTATTASGEVVIDFLQAWPDFGGGSAPVAGANQTQRWSESETGNGVFHVSSTQNGSDGGVMSWTCAEGYWGMGVVSLNPATGGAQQATLGVPTASAAGQSTSGAPAGSVARTLGTPSGAAAANASAGAAAGAVSRTLDAATAAAAANSSSAVSGALQATLGTATAAAAAQDSSAQPAGAASATLGVAAAAAAALDTNGQPAGAAQATLGVPTAQADANSSDASAGTLQAVLGTATAQADANDSVAAAAGAAQATLDFATAVAAALSEAATGAGAASGTLGTATAVAAALSTAAGARTSEIRHAALGKDYNWTLNYRLRRRGRRPI